MYNDLRDEQTITVFWGGENVYSGTVGDMPASIRDSEDFKSGYFYLLDGVEEYEVIAVY